MEKSIFIFSVSQHHRLCQTIGQTWDGNDTTLSGYLGGDDKPEHLEMSISSYMATRTEALGRLDGGDGVPRVRIKAESH